MVNRLLEVAITHNIDIHMGLRKAEEEEEDDIIAAIQQYMAQRE